LVPPPPPLLVLIWLILLTFLENFVKVLDVIKLKIKNWYMYQGLFFFLQFFWCCTSLASFPRGI
jgi:hypothetical protein